MSTPTVILTVWCGAVVAGAAGVIVAVPIAAFVGEPAALARIRDIERWLADGGGPAPTGAP
jgi:predicted PurR-regulated permease PerM